MSAKKAAEKDPPKTAVPAPGKDAPPLKPKRRRLRRFLYICGSLAVLWGTFRFILPWFLLGMAERTLGSFLNGEVTVGDMGITLQGDLWLRNVRATAVRGEESQLLYDVKYVLFTLEGVPFLDEKVTVRRIDLDRPRFYIEKHGDGVWNLAWAFKKPDGAPPPSGGGKLDAFPPEGIRVKRGLLSCGLYGADGYGRTFEADDLDFTLVRNGNGLLVERFDGTFYGGKIYGKFDIASLSPFRFTLRTDIVNAELRTLTVGTSLEKDDIHGRLNGYLSLDSTKPGLDGHAVGAGVIHVAEGNLIRLPFLVSFLNVLSLGLPGNAAVTTADVNFRVTFEEFQLEMKFLGSPASYLGGGTISLNGGKLNLYLIHRLGAGEEGLIEQIPIIGKPLQWLFNLPKHEFTTIEITGTFTEPKTRVVPFFHLQKFFEIFSSDD